MDHRGQLGWLNSRGTLATTTHRKESHIGTSNHCTLELSQGT